MHWFQSFELLFLKFQRDTGIQDLHGKLTPLSIKRLITVYVVFFSQPMYSLMILEISLAANTLLDQRSSITFNSPSCKRNSFSFALLFLI